MEAMILAAGYGTRLLPLTEKIPKPLVKLGNTPMLKHVAMRLVRAGCTRIIINVHHFGDQIEEYVKSENNFGISIEFSDERDGLLDTGGAIKAAARFFTSRKDPFIVYNTDVCTNIDLGRLYECHLRKGFLVTMAVMDRSTSRSLLVSEEDLLVGWRDNKNMDTLWVHTPVDAVTPIAFSGVQVIDPAIFPLITETGAFPLIPLYLRLAVKDKIGVFRHNADFWYDMGTVKNLELAWESVRKLGEF